MDESFPAIERPAPGQPTQGIPLATHQQTKPLRKMLTRLMHKRMPPRNAKIKHTWKEPRKFY